MRGRILLGLIMPLALAAAGRSQAFVPVVETGDSIPGVGNVNHITGLAVDDSGRVLVTALTDNTNPAIRGVLVDSTHVALIQWGDAVSQPPGATISSLNNIVTLSASGVPAFYIGLNGTTGTTDDEGCYVGIPPAQAIRESLPCTATGIPAGSTYWAVLAPKVNDSQQISYHAIYDDPNIPGANNTRALFKLDTVSGVQTLIAKQNDILPGQTWGIWEFAWDELRLGFNNAGQVLFQCSTFDNPNVQNVIYRDNTLIAQTGSPSPFGGGYVSFYAMDLSNTGGYVFACGFGSFQNGIVQSGAGFVATNDYLPSIEPYAISEIYEPQLGDDGRVVWTGLWNLPGGGQGKGLFVDYSLLAEEGETALNGVVAADLLPAGAHYRSLSPSGQYFAFKAVRQDGSQGAYVVDLW